jgi:hypothetical protein
MDSSVVAEVSGQLGSAGAGMVLGGSSEKMEEAGQAQGPFEPAHLLHVAVSAEVETARQGVSQQETDDGGKEKVEAGEERALGAEVRLEAPGRGSGVSGERRVMAAEHTEGHCRQQ